MSEWERVHRDLTSRLGFGDGITEPMADNDTIVEWFEQRTIEAREWWESQRWRDDCSAAGHPDDEDCWEHDPALRLARAEAALASAKAEADALRETVAEVRRDHTMSPNTASRGYDYRMGWWDAINFATDLIQKRDREQAAR